LALIDSNPTAQRYELLDPDVRLMLKVRDGNAAAYEELVHRHQDRLHHVLENLVRDHELAKDLAQEVFLRVFKARERYEPGAKFSTWLYTIANNVALNAKRDNSRRKEVQVEGYSSGEHSIMPMERLAVASSGTMPARRLEKSEQAEIVKHAIDNLNPRQKMAILLSKFEGMGYSDIAEAMGLSAQAVKSLLSRARVNLKQALQPYLDQGLAPGSIMADPNLEGPDEASMEDSDEESNEHTK
jgi:RNA polymerase sigma-70 factor (ECF subfamily)